MSAGPLPVSRVAVDWRRIRRGGARIVVVCAFAVAVTAWLDSTRPHDPLRFGPGLGIENSGSSGVPVGQARGYSFVLSGATPQSDATITGYSLPHIPGVRLRLYAVSGPFRGSAIGFRITPRPTDGYPGRNEFRPLIGARLQTLPARLHWPGPMLVAALVVTPLSPGCHRISGVAIRYNVGSTTFTRSMDGAISVATGSGYCFA
jgi:hypothetical protein